jgi:hypothetical protein
MTTSEHREKIYKYVGTLLGRNYQGREQKDLKALLVAMCEDVRLETKYPLASDVGVVKSITITPVREVPRRKTTFIKAPGSCKYCNHQAGFGRIVCRDCAFKRMKENETEI